MISKEEWSGVLFYSVQGTIKEPQGLVLTVEDIFPMDKGTTGYTNYSFSDPKLADYVMGDTYNPEWKIGHIHSHHSMGVFFSGTDMEELHDNSEFHNYYLSLIVNNDMDFKAKVAFRGTTGATEVAYMARDEEGDLYPISFTRQPNVKLFTMDCEIEAEREVLSVPDSFRERTSEIIAIADAAAQTEQRGRMSSSFVRGSAGGGFGYGSGWSTNGWRDNPRDKGGISLARPNSKAIPAEEDDEVAIEDFLSFLLRDGEALADAYYQKITPLENIEMAIDEIITKVVDMKAVCKNVMANLPGMFEAFYGVTVAAQPRLYISVLEDCVDTLDQYVPDTPKLGTLRTVLYKAFQQQLKKR